MKVKFRDSQPADPIYAEGAQVILVPLTSTPRPARRTRVVRGRRQGAMPSVFADDNDMFDESTWIDVDENDDEENDDER